MDNKDDQPQVQESGGKILQIVVDRVRAVTIRTFLSVQGIKTKAIVDTGAEVTVLSERLYKSLPQDKRPTLQKAKRGLIVAEAGKKMTTCGTFDASFRLGEFEFEWPVYVAPIGDDVLLGCDIIDEMDITVNTKRGIQVKDQWVECEIIRSHDNVGPVRIARAVTVPALSEFVMSASCDRNQDQQTFLFEGDETAKENLLIARSLVSPQTGRVPVKVINQSSSPVKLKKGVVLGKLHPVGSIMPTHENYDISKHSDGISVCQLKSHEDRHDRKKQSNTEAKINSINNSEIDGTNFSDITGNETRQGMKLPEHLKDLFKRSSENLEMEQKEKLASLLNTYQDSFAKTGSEYGKCSILKHKIDTAEAAPVRQPLRRTPQAFQGEEEKYIKEQLEAGVIQPSSSAWSSPIVMVRKKTGDVRVCIDYRKLNERTIKDAYPLPRIDMCLDCLASTKIFSTIDLQSAYMQLEVAKEDRHKTAFITKYGLFEYLVMPFGLCNAPSTFQRCVELIFRGIQWKYLLVYLDDIIVMASNFDEHLDRLEEVFKRLSEAGLKMKASKCEFFKTEVLFLGHCVSQEGIKPNPKTIEAVMSWKIPTNVREVQSYLGLCSYYRQYIENFSHIASPLTNLTKKKVKFIWDDSCQKAYELLKEKLCSAPILALPKPGLKYILDTDASDTGIGGVISQVQEGRERVIAYASKKLDPQQQRYSVTRRELLAVITFMNQFRHYLLGQKFLLRTDHGSLRWIFEFKNPRGQVARWLEVLAQYDFEIQHRPGQKHQNADGLSRKYEKHSCDHDTEDGDVCSECRDTSEDWVDFYDEVDNVIDLGVPVGNCRIKREITSTDPTLRALTRGQAKKMLEADNAAQQQGQHQTAGSITPETMFIPCYTLTELQRLQREDKDLEILHSWLDKNYLPSRDEVAQCSPAVRKYWLNTENIIRKKGVLYQKKWLFDPAEKLTLQLLVPRSLRTEIIRNHHNILMAGHFGVNKTSKKIKEKFYWFQMDEDIRLFIRQCIQCNKIKQPRKKPKARLRTYMAGYPLDRIGIDVMGPLNVTKDKNKYILVIGDYFTRWMEAYSLPSQHAEVVAEKLVHEFISRLGTPLEIHSDQGRNFESSLFKEVLKLLEIKKTRTTAYRPISNGLIERFNETLGRMIKKFVDKNKTNWDKHLDLLLAAYRATPHPATGYSPNMLMFGREVNIPSNILYPFPRQEEPASVHEYVSELRDRLEETYHTVRENLKLAAQRQKRDYDSRIVENVYNIGDLVYKKEGAGKKLDPKYIGPFIITKCLSPSVYKLHGKKITLIVHHDRLKKYTAEKIPAWVVKIKRSLGIQ